MCIRDRNKLKEYRVAVAELEAALQQCTQQQNGTATENARRAAAEARMLLETCAESEQPITQFYLGVAVGALDGEAAACDYYERALKQLPLLRVHRRRLGAARRQKREAKPLFTPRSSHL